MDLDYLIIGCGLAGISFAEYALADNKKILLIDDNSQNSSKDPEVITKSVPNSQPPVRTLPLVYFEANSGLQLRSAY